MLKESELLALKTKVEEAKTTVSELKGHQQALLKQLKDDWGCKTIEDADKKLKTMKASIEKITEDIETKTAELEETYDL